MIHALASKSTIKVTDIFPLQKELDTNLNLQSECFGSLMTSLRWLESTRTDKEEPWRVAADKRISIVAEYRFVMTTLFAHRRLFSFDLRIAETKSP